MLSRSFDGEASEQCIYGSGEYLGCGVRAELCEGIYQRRIISFCTLQFLRSHIQLEQGVITRALRLVSPKLKAAKVQGDIELEKAAFALSAIFAVQGVNRTRNILK